jgi:hypothetical protein
MSNFSLSGYKLVTSFCREKILKVVVCILVRNDIIYHTIDLEKSCNEKSLKIHAIKLNIRWTSLTVCCVCRSPSGNLNQFLKLLEGILKCLCQPSVTFLICGDLNTNVLVESLVEQKLKTKMKTFNLIPVVNIPTRIYNNKGTLIDSIFFENMKYNCILLYPLENGLSNHNAQILILENIKIPLQKPAHKNKIRVTDDQTIAKFQVLLKEEMWDTVYNADNVNRMFNNFHCILLRYFENSFAISYKSYRIEHND